MAGPRGNWRLTSRTASAAFVYLSGLGMQRQYQVRGARNRKTHGLLEVDRHKNEVWTKLQGGDQVDVQERAQEETSAQERGRTCFATNPGIAARTPNLRAVGDGHDDGGGGVHGVTRRERSVVSPS
jgi:hypothetical protein